MVMHRAIATVVDTTAPAATAVMAVMGITLTDGSGGASRIMPVLPQLLTVVNRFGARIG
jgi:hypothetical protein